jgi:hypothetical protein
MTEPKIDLKLDERAVRINSEHAAIVKASLDAKAANHEIVKRAISLGHMLKDVQDGLDHGQWLTWLKTKCPEIKERTAQRYMKLAENENKLRDKINSDTMSDFGDKDIPSDFTLTSAFKLIEKGSGGGDKDTPSGAYEKIEQRLIKKLKDLDVPTAEASVSNTVRALNAELMALKAAELDKTTKKAA